MASATDWILASSSLLAAGVAGYAAWVGLATFKRQRTASDVDLAFRIFVEINRYWDRLSSDRQLYEYNMGQILAHFEIAAALFNRNILSTNAPSILGDHIVEVFTQIQASDAGKSLIAQCCSSDSTFSELIKFVRNRMPQALSSYGFQEQK
ncbi:hypothetical protein [Sphingomonas sp. Leaf242]|uniref:hypothetical protein n=1 Tax=Sphingomonas sp. Leaf242 TaxID=1736304 RepID=UPI0012E32538|nr:hypothetical protein [Sphingomonas sp. Leaf242]